jgi:hypothetical protein
MWREEMAWREAAWRIDACGGVTAISKAAARRYS